MTTENNYAYLEHELKRLGGVINFYNGKLEVIYADAKPEQAVITTIQSGQVNYGLHIKECMPVFLLGTSDFEVDIFLNVHDLLAGKARGELSNYKGDFTFSWVEATTLELIAQRSFCLCEWFIRHFKNALADQRRHYRNRQDIIQAIGEQSAYLETREMFAGAKLYSEPAIAQADTSVLLPTEQ